VANRTAGLWERSIELAGRYGTLRIQWKAATAADLFGSEPCVAARGLLIQTAPHVRIPVAAGAL